MNFPSSQFCVLIVIFKFMTHVIIWTRNFVSGTETRAVAHKSFAAVWTGTTTTLSAVNLVGIFYLTPMPISLKRRINSISSTSEFSRISNSSLTNSSNAYTKLFFISEVMTLGSYRKTENQSYFVNEYFVITVYMLKMFLKKLWA